MSETILSKPRVTAFDQYYTRAFSSYKELENKLKQKGKLITDMISLTLLKTRTFPIFYLIETSLSVFTTKSKQISIVVPVLSKKYEGE